MKPARVAIFSSAAIAGVGAFLMMIAQPKPQGPIRIAVPAPPPPMDQVLVADKDIPFGNRIEDGDLRWQSWPKNGLPPEVIIQARDPNALGEFNGWLADSHLTEGQPVKRQAFTRSDRSGVLAALLPSGMRAIAIGIESQGSTTAGNFVSPGDYVDVILTYRDADVARAEGSDGMVSATLLRNVRVLAIGQALQKPEKDPAIGGSTATLELTPRQVEQVVLAQRVGQLSLSLRSVADSTPTAVKDTPDRDQNMTIVRFGVPVPARVR
jgi:pilus assembly protein CpaB